MLEVIGDDLNTLLFDLVGVPSPIGTILPANASNVPIILGYAGGYETTLYRCSRMGFGEMAVGYVGCTYSVGVVFHGCHFEDEASIVFDQVSVGFRYLEEWVGSSGFNLRYKRDMRGSVSAFKVDYELPDSREFLCGEWIVQLDRRVWFNPYDLPRFRAEEQSYLTIRSSKKLPHLTFREGPIYLLGSFLSLAIGRPVVPTFEFGCNDNYMHEGANGDTYAKEIYVYSIFDGSEVSKSESRFFDMLFSFADVQETFAQHVELWFAKHHRLKEAVELYSSLIYTPSVRLHWAFLTMSQALEAYHRNMYGGSYMSKEDYAPTLNILIKAIPLELTKVHRESLAKSLEYGYEFSLRKRLKLTLQDILADYQDEVGYLIGNKRERERFISDVVNTRNYFTHRTEEGRQQAVTNDRELLTLYHRMKHLLQLCFLAELKIPQEAVKKRLKRNHSFREWAAHLPD